MVEGGGAASSGTEDAEDVFLLHDEVLLAAQRDLAAGVLAEEDPIALFHREGELLAVLGHSAGPDRDHFALLRLLFRGVGNEDAAVLAVLLLETPDEHAVVERTQFRRGYRSHRAGDNAVRDRPQFRSGCLSHGAGASLVVQVVWSAAGGIVQRAQCTTQLVQMLGIDLVYYSNHTQEAEALQFTTLARAPSRLTARPRAAASGATRFPLTTGRRPREEVGDEVAHGVLQRE